MKSSADTLLIQQYYAVDLMLSCLADKSFSICVNKLASINFWRYFIIK